MKELKDDDKESLLRVWTLILEGALSMDESIKLLVEGACRS